MHEYSLVENLVDTLVAGLAKENVTSPDAVKEVKIRVGALAVHSVESFEQAFRMRASDTLLRNAKLLVEVVPAKYKCGACGHEGVVGLGDADPHDAMPVKSCPKCGAVCMVEGGRGIEPMDVMVEEPPPSD